MPWNKRSAQTENLQAGFYLFLLAVSGKLCSTLEPMKKNFLSLIIVGVLLAGQTPAKTPRSRPQRRTAAEKKKPKQTQEELEETSRRL